MKHLLRFTAGALLLAGGFLVQAQFRPPEGLPPKFHHLLLDVLAGGPDFYGRAKIQMSNGPDQNPTLMSCGIAVLSGNMRMESDTFNVGSNMPPIEAERLKHMHVITILRPDRNRVYMVFPEFKSFVESVYGTNIGTDVTPPPKISKTPLGKENVGGQPCDKSRWNVTESDGEQYDLTIWTATNWSNFPIQIKIGAPPALVEFQNLHLEAPNSNLFELPADYNQNQASNNGFFIPLR
jgi:hypothetical protein